MMSGTSLDGVDAALLEVGGTTPGTFSWQLLGFHSESYLPEERDSIRRAIERGGPAELARLHAALGERFARCALAGCARAGVDPASVAAIGSHGQTVWHDPPSGDARGATLQLGDPATIAEITGIPVVSDFRTRDVAAGGHGAPLVPWPDRLLFSAPDRPRALQNLGGMANVTWLPAASEGEPVLAFDTGPGVALIDTAAELATDGRRTFDADGELAAAGEVDNDLLDQLLQHPFLHRPPPKSTGREVFGSAFVEEAGGTPGAAYQPRLGRPGRNAYGLHGRLRRRSLSPLGASPRRQRGPAGGRWRAEPGSGGDDLRPARPRPGARPVRAGSRPGSARSRVLRGAGVGAPARPAGEFAGVDGGLGAPDSGVPHPRWSVKATGARSPWSATRIPEASARRAARTRSRTPRVRGVRHCGHARAPGRRGCGPSPVRWDG